MNKIKFNLICYYILITILFSYESKGQALNILLKRLNKIKNFHANFIQKVIDYNGIIIQNEKGKIWIKYPNLFKYHSFTPNENIILSNGKYLWFYNTNVKQVSIFSIKKISKNNPLILIINHKNINWNNLIINQQKNNFILIPKNHQFLFKKFNIVITKEGKIINFNIIEQDGKNIVYKLINHKYEKISSKIFNFKKSKSITIDDQR